MEVTVVTVLIFHLLCGSNVTPVTPVTPIKEITGIYRIKTPDIHYIRKGDTVDLSCDKNHRDKTMWFGQKNNRSPFIIISAEMKSERRERPSVKYYWGYNSRFNITWNPTNNSSTLTIRNINESDDGFYFCTVGEGIMTTTGTGHILILEGTVTDSPATTPSVSTAGQVRLSGDSGQCGLIWSLVAIMSLISILITALVFLIIQNTRRRNTETSQTGQRMQRIENMEEDEEVQYSALRFSKPKQTAK